MAFKSRSITIDHTQCGATDSTDKDTLVKLSHSTLKTVANGGNVANSSGYDVLFSLNADGTSPLSWEMVKYDGTNGTIEAWVKIPTLSHTTDTVIYITYGSRRYTSFQGGSTGAAWNSGFKHVVHTGDGTTLDLNDKTTNGTNGTNSSGSATTGKVGGGFGVTAGGRYTTAGNLANIIGSAAVHTISCWVKFTTQGATNYLWDLDNANSLGAFCNLTATTHEWGYGGSYRSYSGISTTTGTWYYCTWVKTAAGDNGKFYINGVEQTSYSGSLGNPNTSATPGGQFGNYHTSSALCLDGVLDETRISNVARSADWILQSYNNQNNPGNIGSAGFYTVGSEVQQFETVYWVGGTGTFDTNPAHTSHWSTTSGGSGGAPIPDINAADDVVFDGNSGGGTVTIDDIGCRHFTATGFTGTFASSGSNIVIFGNFILGSGCTWTCTANTIVSYTSTFGLTSFTVNSNGVDTSSCLFSIGGNAAGTWNYSGNWVGGWLNATAGTHNFSGNNSAKKLSLGLGTYNLGTGTFSIVEDDTFTSSAGVAVNASATVNASTSTIKFTKTGSGTTTFDGGGKTFNKLWFARGSSTGSIILLGANTFAELKDDGSAAHTITMPNSTTTLSAAAGWNINGTSGNLITMQRTGGSGSWTISCTSGTVTANYVSLSNSTATGGATFNATNSTNGGGNSGWNFITLYTKALTETVALVAAIAKQTNKPVKETITLASTVTAIKTALRTLTETVTLVETLKKKTIKAYALTITLVEVVAKKTTKAYTLTITLVETTTKKMIKSFAELVTLTDSERVKVIAKVVKETITLVLTFARGVVAHRTLAETITLVEATAAKIRARILKETLTLVETTKKKTIKAYVETVTLVEHLYKMGGKRIAETITLVVSIAKISFQSVVIHETITLVENLVKKTTKPFVLALTLVETAIYRKQYNRTLAETITLAATIQKIKTQFKSFVLTITLVDTVRRVTTYRRALVERIKVTARFLGLINGKDIRYIQKYINQAGSYVQKYVDQGGTYIKKYLGIPDEE